MSMKKTDLEKHLAKKLDGKMKSGIVPQRFAQGSAAAGAQGARKPKNPAARLVPVACRLPSELVARLRDRAVGYEGGMNALLAAAVTLWLQSTAGEAPVRAA
jgi:hypothetical protein